VGVSKLRSMNAMNIRKLQSILVFQDSEEPLAVLVPYSMFCPDAEPACRGAEFKITNARR